MTAAEDAARRAERFAYFVETDAWQELCLVINEMGNSAMLANLDRNDHPREYWQGYVTALRELSGTVAAAATAKERAAAVDRGEAEPEDRQFLDEVAAVMRSGLGGDLA